jgi:hypothetical protein
LCPAGRLDDIRNKGPVELGQRVTNGSLWIAGDHKPILSGRLQSIPGLLTRAEVSAKAYRGMTTVKLNLASLGYSRVTVKLFRYSYKDRRPQCGAISS